jgi:two-component system response regulator ResD
MKTILIVDDEEKIREVIASYLYSEGYRVFEAQTGAEALHHVRNESIDLVVLDLMLPDMPGEEVCRTIRQHLSIAVLMLTAKVSEDVRVHGLSLGADDYVLKPFSLRELAARTKVILRRANDDTLLADCISFGELEIDTAKHEVYKRGELVNLTPNEFKLLLILARHPERTFIRDELIEKVLGFDFEGDVRTIDQHIKNLRQKIENDPKQPQYIVTVFGVGYRFIGGGNHERNL